METISIFGSDINQLFSPQYSFREMSPLAQAGTDVELFPTPAGIFPDLESLWGPNSSETEKRRIVVALLQTALESEDDL